MSYELQIIDYQSVLYKKSLMLRNEVLRQPLGLTLEPADILDDKNQYITIAHNDGHVFGCLMIKPLSEDVVKFRQMAIDTPFQGNGIGTTLLHYAENFCLMNNYKICELHARKEAIGFYRKNGYIEIGHDFIEVGINHKKMIKNLDPVIL